MNRIETIRQELKNSKYLQLVTSQDYPALAFALNEKPLIKNPQPQKEIPKPITIMDLWINITPQEGLELYEIPGLKNDVEGAIASNNRNSLMALTAIAAQVISAESVKKIQALLAETILDPNYKTQVEGESLAEQFGLGFVEETEIQSALNL